jgi:hypothetical protein
MTLIERCVASSIASVQRGKPRCRRDVHLRYKTVSGQARLDRVAAHAERSGSFRAPQLDARADRARAVFIVRG